ncbi:MAG TPA: hypothetical protein VGO11_24365 [Chthoniobacteraceae bacterium]|jgi:hypothetical protein|nr:hypothetical protein [Chthoniobacteraceae bacterium]
MDDARQWAIGYLAARGDAPWRWVDAGEVIAWSDGTTIVFGAEVAFVLEWLIPHGWPPFGALVWLFAACRGKLPPAAADEPRRAGPHDLGRRLREMLAVVEAGLSNIAKLPEAVRASPKAKAVLAETIFERVGTKPGEPALRQAAVELLRSGELTDRELNLCYVPPAAGQGEFETLYHGLKVLTPESLALRLRTGLETLPQAAALPAVPAAQVRTMLANLRADPEYEGLARLTRDFMAALQLPRRLAESDEMALGGFADLSNRGNLDRLLLSELAHDDLTLAVRIALQEALYLRREPPARQPPSTLALLLDSGVRLWGVPRLLATAVALALIGRSAQHGKLAVFRASGAGLAEVDLLTREGLTAHLAALETHAHPGAALPAFRRTLDDAGQSDAVLVTQRDVAQDPAFRRSLQAAQFESLYLAVVDRDGSFELLRTPHSTAPLCRAQVNVDALFPAPPPAESPRLKLIDRAAHPDLPLIFSIAPFPLLMPVRGKIQASVATPPQGGVCVLQDRRLLRWRNQAHGAFVVAAQLPPGATRWLGELADGSFCVVKSHSEQRRVTCRMFFENGVLLRGFDLELAQPAVRAEVHGGVLYVICREAHAYDLVSGAHLGSCRVLRRLSHGRYFLSSEGWRVLVWDGLALRLESVHLPSPVPHTEVIRVFNRRGHEGPWSLTGSGDLYASDGACVLRLGPLREVATVFADGDRLLVVRVETGKTELVDLTQMSRRVLAKPLSSGEWESFVQPPTMSVRTHFIGIATWPGRLQLVSQVGRGWTLLLREDRLVLTSGAVNTGVKPQPLAPVAEAQRIGASLRLAQWPDGRCAWLDDDGMLHLRCAERTLPEISIVLCCDSPLAAWSSDGLWHGREFFIGAHESTPASEIWKRILAFTP